MFGHFCKPVKYFHVTLAKTIFTLSKLVMFVQYLQYMYNTAKGVITTTYFILIMKLIFNLI